MNNELTLPVTYKGEEHEFPFRLMSGGYMPRFVVLVNNVEIVIEADDLGELRAIIYDAEQIVGSLPEKGLLEAITVVVAQLTGR